MGKVRIETKLRNGGKLPVQGKPGSAGHDVASTDDVNIPAFSRVMVGTGVFTKIPLGYEIQLRPRSGLAWKKGVTVLNTPGTIDFGYLAEIKVILINTTNKSVHIEKGERIAQFVVKVVEDVEYILVDEFSDVEYDRNGGFGSSGSK